MSRYTIYHQDETSQIGSGIEHEISTAYLYLFYIPNIKANKILRSVVTGRPGWSASPRPISDNPNHSFDMNQIRIAEEAHAKKDA